MKVILNDSEIVVDQEYCDLESFLPAVGYQAVSGMAIAVNDEIITRSSWSSFIIRENDNILIITATQGG